MSKTLIITMPDGWDWFNCYDKCASNPGSNLCGCEPCPLTNAKEAVEVKATSEFNIVYDEMDCRNGFDVDGKPVKLYAVEIKEGR